METDLNLTVRVYLSGEYNLDQVEGSGRIVWMNVHQEQDWKGYKYGFQIVGMASGDQDRLKQYFLKLQEEELSPHGEKPFDDYEKYIAALSNRKREVSLTKRSLRIVNDILHWLKN